MLRFAKDRKNGDIIKLDAISKSTKHLHDLECLICSNTLILKDGEIKVKHFAHKSSTAELKCMTIIKAGGGESWMHKTAKELVKGFLDNGGGIISISECSICKGQRKSLIKRLSSDQQVQLEYPDKDYIADIAITIRDSYGTVRPSVIIEIMHSHKTRDDTSRPEPWYEFSANDVVNSNFHSIDKLIYFRNHRNATKWEKCIAKNRTCQLVRIDSKLNFKDKDKDSIKIGFDRDEICLLFTILHS